MDTKQLKAFIIFTLLVVGSSAEEMKLSKNEKPSLKAYLVNEGAVTQFSFREGQNIYSFISINAKIYDSPSIWLKRNDEFLWISQDEASMMMRAGDFVIIDDWNSSENVVRGMNELPSPLKDTVNRFEEQRLHGIAAAPTVKAPPEQVAYSLKYYTMVWWLLILLAIVLLVVMTWRFLKRRAN